MKTIAKIVFTWLLVATGVGMFAAMTIGNGDHGSAAFAVWPGISLSLGRAFISSFGIFAKSARG